MASPTNSDAIESALSVPGYLPEGVDFAFLAASRDRPTIIAILFVGALVYLILALRVYARIFVVKAFGLDDWLVVATLAPYTAFIALCIVLIHLGSGRHFDYIQYILSDPQIDQTEVLDFVAHILYTTALVICRLSGLAFYARISNRHRDLTWAIRAAALFVVLAYLPQLFLIIFHCIPVTGLWPYSFQPAVDDYSCIQWGTIYVTNSTISLVCDLILFTIPVFLISKLKISMTQKLGLCCVLMPGLLVIAISCARMYLIVIGQWDIDESWSYDPLLAVEVSEIGSTLIALSVPALKPFFSSLFEFLDRTFISRGGRSGRFRSITGTNGTKEAQDHRTGRFGDRYSTAPPYAADMQPNLHGRRKMNAKAEEDLELSDEPRHSSPTQDGMDMSVRSGLSQHRMFSATDRSLYEEATGIR